MIALLGAYVVWRIARRLVPLMLIGALALVLLASNRHLPAAASQLRRAVQAEIHVAQRTLTHELQSGSGR